MFPRASPGVVLFVSAATVARATSLLLREAASASLNIGRTTRSWTTNRTAAVSDISIRTPSGNAVKDFERVKRG